MSEVVNIYDAKTNLSALIERAVAGEEVVIARAGSRSFASCRSERYSRVNWVS